MLRAGSTRGEPGADGGQGVVGGQGCNVARCGVLDEDLVEKVGGVFGTDANAAASDFFGHDGVAHQKRGDEECRGATAEKRQKAERLVSDFKCKDDGGQEGAGRSGEHGGHADERGNADIDAEGGENGERCCAED